MRALVSEWLNSREEQLSVFEGEDEIILKRHAETLLLSAQLTSTATDNAALYSWMRLGAASLHHFPGALAQKPETGALWLIQNLRGAWDEADVCGSLQTLLNQRDTWRASAARLARPALNLKPTSLRSQPY
jgi:hypothetical protein